jgi:hypothetical protein
MIMHLATFARNALLDALETAIGANAILKLRSGASPATGDAASTGTVIATMNLPADWMAAASSGSKAMLGTWQDTAADAAGTVGHFEICTSAGTPGLRGDVTLTGGGGLIELDAVTLNLGQSVSITSFTLTAPNP